MALLYILGPISLSYSPTHPSRLLPGFSKQGISGARSGEEDQLVEKMGLLALFVLFRGQD